MFTLVYRPCQPCILCKQGNLSIYFHPKTWKNRASIDQLRVFEPALAIQLDSCICRRCIGNVEMMSVSSQSSFIPRWRKKSSPHKHCCVPGCVNPTQKVTKLVNHEQICEFFSMPDIDNLETNDVSGYTLCITHYERWISFICSVGWVYVFKKAYICFSPNIPNTNVSVQFSVKRQPYHYTL